MITYEYFYKNITKQETIFRTLLHAHSNYSSQRFNPTERDTVSVPLTLKFDKDISTFRGEFIKNLEFDLYSKVLSDIYTHKDIIYFPTIEKLEEMNMDSYEENIKSWIVPDALTDMFLKDPSFEKSTEYISYINLPNYLKSFHGYEGYLGKYKGINIYNSFMLGRLSCIYFDNYIILGINKSDEKKSAYELSMYEPNIENIYGLDKKRDISAVVSYNYKITKLIEGSSVTPIIFNQKNTMGLHYKSSVCIYEKTENIKLTDKYIYFNGPIIRGSIEIGKKEVEEKFHENDYIFEDISVDYKKGTVIVSNLKLIKDEDYEISAKICRLGMTFKDLKKYLLFFEKGLDEYTKTHKYIVGTTITYQLSDFGHIIFDYDIHTLRATVQLKVEKKEVENDNDINYVKNILLNFQKELKKVDIEYEHLFVEKIQWRELDAIVKVNMLKQVDPADQDDIKEAVNRILLTKEYLKKIKTSDDTVHSHYTVETIKELERELFPIIPDIKQPKDNYEI